MKYRYLRFPEGKFKAVTFSYDDGVTHDKRLAAIFDRFGMKATFNINSAFIGNEQYLTADEIQTHLLDKGHEIAVHGHRHRAPGMITTVDGIQDVLDCRRELESRFGRIVRGMAYPDSGITRFTGDHTYDDVKGYLKALGITYARTLLGDNDRFELPTDWYAWMPTAHHDNAAIMEYAAKFVGLQESAVHGAGSYPRLCYIWGHSYEFDRKKNWDHMEALCETLGGKADTWYATNGEIYAYVKAFEALECSADGTRVHNPTAQDVWFVVDGQLKHVPSGETMTI